MVLATPNTFDACRQVDDLIDRALAANASDIHLEPIAGGYEIKQRVDGMLTLLQAMDASSGSEMINRLMFLARLLTYRTEIPQEGRLSVHLPPHPPVEVRLAIMPCRHGLRAVLRLPTAIGKSLDLSSLCLPTQVLRELLLFAQCDSGLLAITGPAGSGKTTTVYALLEHMVRHHPGQCIISLEDPIERDIPGVTQIEINPFGQMTHAAAMRSILRQDPQVLALGEIRDAATASLAMQAALTGHRLICTMHAGSPAAALRRWCEMGIETHQISSAVRCIVTQRLVRKLNPGVSAGESAAAARYHGRFPLAQVARMDDTLRAALLCHADAAALEAAIAKQPQYQSLRDVAAGAANVTDQAELDRVLGPVDSAF